MYGYFNPYQQAQYSQTPMYQQRQEQTTDDRIWVQNETAAEAYLIAPNSFVRLWDANKPVFYERRADATGRPLPMERYEFKRISSQIQEINTQTENVLREEIKALNERITALERKEQNHVSESYADDLAVQSV